MQEIAFIAGKGTWEEREMKEGDASVNIWAIKSGRGRDEYYTRYINYKVSETPLIVPICRSVIVTDRTPMAITKILCQQEIEGYEIIRDDLKKFGNYSQRKILHSPDLRSVIQEIKALSKL